MIYFTKIVPLVAVVLVIIAFAITISCAGDTSIVDPVCRVFTIGLCNCSRCLDQDGNVYQYGEVIDGSPDTPAGETN